MRQIRVQTCRIRAVRRDQLVERLIDQLRFMGLRFMLTPMLQPFHFAFFVRDLVSTRRFYGDVLGCREGRSTESWVDFDFFGNQISAHNTGKPIPTENTGLVEGVPVPMPHFGALLPWDEFGSLVDRIRAAGVPFVLEPRIRYPGQLGEQATMFLLDPSGNALEFKSFKHPEHVFTA